MIMAYYLTLYDDDFLRKMNNMIDIKAGYSFIHKYIKKNPAKMVLELGCGRAAYKHSIKGSYIGMDITNEDYGLDPRIVDILASARFLPFKENRFDLVFVVASFYLFPGPILCLKEIRNCLKPGGKFICFDYTRKTLERFVYAYHKQNVQCHSIWKGNQLARLLRVAGFKDIKWLVPDTGYSWKVWLAHRMSIIYRYIHDFREGWWVVEGKK